MLVSLYMLWGFKGFSVESVSALFGSSERRTVFGGLRVIVWAAHCVGAPWLLERVSRLFETETEDWLLSGFLKMCSIWEISDHKVHAGTPPTDNSSRETFL